MVIKFFSTFNRELKRKATLILIHHGRIKTMRFSFSMFSLFVVFFFWTCFTLWTGCIYGKHINYLVAKADSKIAKMRMLFFADQIKKSNEILSQIKQNDENIRNLLAMNSKKVIIESGLGHGGPTIVESNALSMLLSGKIDDIDYQNISNRFFELLEDYKISIKSYSEIIKHINKQREIFRYTPSIWPCNGIISSYYGIRFHPIFGNKIFHPAIDIANKENTPIVSTADGIVVFAGWQSGYGNVVAIQHGHKYRTIYAHLYKILIKKGDIVVKGQEIAKMGSTGRATGSHVHYELHLNKKPVNPVKYLNSYLN